MGDQVFGFTLFGAYSSLLLVPGKQVRKIPQLLGGKVLSLESAAALPAVAATALHAISQAGAWPEKICTKNRAALVHSAAGIVIVVMYSFFLSYRYLSGDSLSFSPSHSPYIMSLDPQEVLEVCWCKC